MMDVLPTVLHAADGHARSLPGVDGISQLDAPLVSDGAVRGSGARELAADPPRAGEPGVGRPARGSAACSGPTRVNGPFGAFATSW